MPLIVFSFLVCVIVEIEIVEAGSVFHHECNHLNNGIVFHILPVTDLVIEMSMPLAWFSNA